MKINKKNHCPNATIFAPSSDSLEKERRAVTSNEQINDEAIAIFATILH
jgi:hypothetical protein